jgi:hypothetical protein
MASFSRRQYAAISPLLELQMQLLELTVILVASLDCIPPPPECGLICQHLLCPLSVNCRRRVIILNSADQTNLIR